MSLNFLKEFNWIDIFVVIILFRICYISLKNGFPAAFFKLLGVISAIYLSLHYYTPLAQAVEKRYFGEKIHVAYLDFIFLVLLAILGNFIFVFLRVIFNRFIKMEAVSNLDKWGGLILGAARGILLSGLLLFIFAASPFDYLRQSVNRSSLGTRILKVAPQTYIFIWDAAACKFMAREKFNSAVLVPEKEIIKK